jgi:hypothetical protein
MTAINQAGVGGKATCEANEKVGKQNKNTSWAKHARVGTQGKHARYQNDKHATKASNQIGNGGKQLGKQGR